MYLNANLLLSTFLGAPNSNNRFRRINFKHMDRCEVCDLIYIANKIHNPINIFVTKALINVSIVGVHLDAE